MEATKTVREQMISLLAEWEVSKMSKKEFCTQHQIAYHRFHYWHKRYGTTQGSTSKQGSATFLPLHIESPASHTEVMLPSGVRIIFHQPVSAPFLHQLIR